MPHRLTCSRLPVRVGWKRSAAHTPIWQVTELSTRIVVLIAAKVRLSLGVSCAHSSGVFARVVKYIANSPAKNISSLARQTMVPTATGLGRLTRRCGRATAAVVADTGFIMAEGARIWDLGPRCRRVGPRDVASGSPHGQFANRKGRACEDAGEHRGG